MPARSQRLPKALLSDLQPRRRGARLGEAAVHRQAVQKTEHPEDYVFIAANVYDNHALMEHDPDYVRMLENLPEEQRRAWLLGQWDIFEGQYFAEFDRNVHVCRPHGIPAHWRR